RYSNISDHDLDIRTRHFKRIQPNSGLCYLTGFLKTHKIKIQRECIHQSLLWIDGLDQVLRKHTLEHREYESPPHNSAWHMDGHHKLINWGIVMHGFVDGFD
ncbi:hypothetical protein B0H17DRAFT_849826, partial [Mycena rosella]